MPRMLPGALLLFSLFLFGYSPFAQAAASDGLAGKSTLVMATEAGFAPYEYYDANGHVAGIDPDIAKAIADSLGLTLEIKDMHFDAIIPEVQAGRADFGAAAMTAAEDQRSVVDFSIPYAVSRQVFLVRSGSKTFSGVDGMDGKAVGVQLGTVSDLKLTKDFPKVRVERYKKYLDAVAALREGKLDAIVIDELPAKDFMARYNDLAVLDKELLTNEFAICVQKGNKELLGAINKTLGELISSGQVEAFTKKHTAR